MKKLCIVMLVFCFALTGCGSEENTTTASPVEEKVVAEKTEENVVVPEDIQTEVVEPVKEEADSAVALEGDEILEIREKMFIAQVNDIYVNAEDYFDKTIQYEGYLEIYEASDLPQPKYFVFRNGPGCCANDGLVGFEVAWDGAYPQENAWVRVIGKLELYEDNGFDYLRMALDSLDELEVRGEENVYQ